jgi:hypothetical protein
MFKYTSAPYSSIDMGLKMTEKGPVEQPKWKKCLSDSAMFMLSALLVLTTSQIVPPETCRTNQYGVRESRNSYSSRTADGYEKLSIKKINNDSADLKSLAYFYKTFENAEEKYYLLLTPKERKEMKRKVTSLDDINEIYKIEIPYMLKELKSGINKPTVNFPRIGIIYTYEDIGGKYTLWNNLTEINMFEVYHPLQAVPIIAHETFHGQEYGETLIDILKGRKYFNEGRAVLFEDEICANMALDSNSAMSIYLSGRIASDIRGLAYENAMRTGHLSEFVKYFGPDTKPDWNDESIWNKYNKPAILAYIKSIETGKPILVDGTLIDGLYNFWEAAEKMNDNNELEGKIFVKKEGLLVPIYDGFTHGYLNGNRFVPLSIPSEVAYEKYWLNEK